MTIRLAIIGCGAVTEQKHLPLAIAHPQVEVCLLVDRDLGRAQALAKQYQVAKTAIQLEMAFTGIDAAIIASPPSTHAPIAITLLQRGIHVLVEKPMALTSAECEAMIAASEQHAAVLAVGLMRRFGMSVQWVKQAIRTQLLGPLLAWEVQEGHLFDWPIQSDYFLRREQSGGGVLADIGAHTLDLLLWWLGEGKSVQYFDDAYGGVEANCQLTLTSQKGVSGQVYLSRTRKLRNSARFTCQQGIIEVGMGEDWVKLWQADQPLHLSGFGQETAGQAPIPFDGLFVRQLEDWLAAIRGEKSPMVSGREAQRSIAFIEACYAVRQPLVLAWDNSAL